MNKSAARNNEVVQVYLNEMLCISLYAVAGIIKHIYVNTVNIYVSGMPKSPNMKNAPLIHINAYTGIPQACVKIKHEGNTTALQAHDMIRCDCRDLIRFQNLLELGLI